MIYPDQQLKYRNTPSNQPNKVSYMNTLDDSNENK